ncbi:MAG: NAD-dependent epimerase/dehydratase family protein [Planctomycetes bacterium]|nr:NAD-dependent epimerase/dehydratase family protein [Planctomycetota bacterium]
MNKLGQDFDCVLVTGAAGFIGSSLVDRLLAAGKTVVGLDNFDPYYSPAAKRRNLTQANANPNFKLFEGDILDKELLARLFQDYSFDVVVHLAALAGVRPSIADPAAYFRNNVDGTMNLLEVVRHNKGQRFVMASSSSVYGNLLTPPFDEDMETARPVSPYAASKKAGEVLAHCYHHLFQVPITLLRFFTVYGPRQRPEMAIAKFVNLIREGKSIPMFGDGDSARDYTFIDDVTAGIQGAMERCAGYSIYNLGNSSPVSLKDMIAAVGRACQVEPRIDQQGDQPGDVQLTCASIQLAAEEIGYAPLTSLDDGLRAYLAWLDQSDQPKVREQEDHQ